MIAPTVQSHHNNHNSGVFQQLYECEARSLGTGLVCMTPSKFLPGDNPRVDRTLSLEDVNSDFCDSSDYAFCNTQTIVNLGLSNPEWSLTGLLYRLYIVSDGWKLKSPRVNLHKRTQRPRRSSVGSASDSADRPTPELGELLCSFFSLSCR